ncbi:hypothetical protein FQN60_009386 [Etheostoma spectabile]|uniref:ZP domain-containing protein n=1 Tax=Etheostoma spectabile TaxID=54343 RepID=A0A5J5DJB1_9PERO|nr:hypothetical protein FQN60_009386 [Etheostoma spectabile]
MASPWKHCGIILLSLLLLHLQSSTCLDRPAAASVAVSPVHDEEVAQSDGGMWMEEGLMSADQPFRRQQSPHVTQRKLLQVPGAAVPFPPLKVLSNGEPCVLFQARKLSLRYEKQKQLDLTERAFSPQKPVDTSQSVCRHDKATMVMRFGDVEDLRGLSIRLQLSNTFLESSGQWWFSVDSVSLLYNSSEEAVFNASDVYAPASSSYHCDHIQAFNVTAGGFSPASVCSTFLTPAILMGLITSLILLLVLAYALHMVIHLKHIEHDDEHKADVYFPQSPEHCCVENDDSEKNILMEPAVVRCLPGEPKLTISFCLDGSHKHMLRDQDETLGKVLVRISNGIAKGQGKAKKSKKNKGQKPGETPEQVIVKLFNEGQEVAETVLNSEAWQDGAVLHVGGCKYAIQRNAPTLTTAELPVSLLAGFPVCPNLEVDPEAASEVPGKDSGWTEVGCGRVHVPSNQDIGYRLKLRCTPKDGGRSGVAKELVSVGAVEAGPGVCTFDNRHAYTVKEAEWPAVRVVSYNILADVYAQTELSKTVLYPYCAPYALQLDYRQNLIKKELAGLTPALDAFGLDGVFRIKDKQHEGLATFYRRSKFQLLSRRDIVLNEALTSDPIHATLLQKVSANGALKDKVLQRSTTLQVLLCTSCIHWE